MFRGKNKHYYTKGIIGIVYALEALLLGIYDMKYLIMFVILPLLSSVIFIITKLPAVGIFFTALYMLNRIDVFVPGNGSFLAIVFIVVPFIYFVHVDCKCLKDRKM